MQLNLAGKPANIDWVHVLQIGLGVLSIVLVQVAKLPNLSADIVSALVLAATILGLLYRSIFHQEPPKPPDGISTEKTPTAEVPLKGENNPFWRLRSPVSSHSFWRMHSPMPRRSLFRSLLGTAATFALFAFSATGSVGCGPQVQGWLATISQFLSYVTTFIQGANALWAIISPLLTVDIRAKADLEFARAIQATTDAQAAGEELVAAAVNGTGPAPDVGAIIAAVQTAAAQIYAVISLYSKPVSVAPRVSTVMAGVEHQYRVIAAWRT